ncbi:MAG TPA: hypothetical protein VEI97_15830, partial [bacterium]|nr:hypothetical protein [bacterium]
RLAPAGAVRARTVEDYRTGRLVGTAEQVREQLAAWAGAGVATVIVSIGALPFAVTNVDDLELLAAATKTGHGDRPKG